MGGRLVVVSGTGTGIGKTHVGEALLLAMSTFTGRVAGVKPVETGLAEGGPSDALRLARASSFHVKHSGVRFANPVSPHIAARDAGEPIVVERVAAQIHQLREAVDILLVELAGGLFTPLSETTMNVHLARALMPDSLVIVAPDRLGVLHEVLSTTIAAGTLSVAASAVVLSAPERPDSSTGRNAIELTRLAVVPCVTMCVRASSADLALNPAIRTLARRLLGEPGAFADRASRGSPSEEASPIPGEAERGRPANSSDDDAIAKLSAKSPSVRRGGRGRER